MKKKTQRMEWLRVNIETKNSKELIVKRYSKQGSGIISSIVFSDGIIEIPENKSFLKNAPKQIVEKDKVVMTDYEFTLKKLNSILNSIKN